MGRYALIFTGTDWVSGSVGSAQNYYFGASGGNTYSASQVWNAGATVAGNMCLQPNGGYVGIGKTGPVYTLDVNGDINLPAANAYRVGATAGVSGSFTTVDLKIVTVTKGIITSIV